MADKEIKIVDYELANCEGNLLTICSEWESTPRVSKDEVYYSEGRSANKLLEIIEVATMVQKSLENLLQNTLSFLVKTGVEFKTADEEGAQYIDSIVK